MSSPLIIHTEASDGWGGQEMRIFKELQEMRARGYRVALAAPAHSHIYKRCAEAGVECWPVKFSKLSKLSDIAYLTWRFLRKKPLVVGTHSSSDSWAGLIAAALAGVPAKIRYRHVSVPVRANFWNRFIYNLPDDIITTGECICEAIEKSLGVRPGRLHTIATGINPPSNMLLPNAARAALQKKLGLPENARFIGMAAVLRSWKGHDFLMRAFDLISRKYPEYHLVLAYPIREDMAEILTYFKKIAGELSCARRIHFAGHETLVFENLAAWDCALLTSTKNEGIPQSLLQAMFARIPVVGTNVGGIPEIVKHSQTGLLVPPCNEEALSQAIDEVLSNPTAAAQRVENAYRMVCENHTIKIMGDRVEMVIKNILDRKRKSGF